MDRVQLLLLGLPLFLFCSDLLNLFTAAPPPPPPSRPPPNPTLHHLSSAASSSPVPPSHIYAAPIVVDLKFCVSCSYRGTAMTIKKMLETSFPGIIVNLGNYPPALPKRLLSKAVPVVQVGVIGIVIAGEQIFPRLGFVAPPPWYYNLRANRFGTIASTWLFGNFAQNFLQSSGGFEVYCNGELVFSKLKENRFPGELELQGLIRSRLPPSIYGNNHGGFDSVAHGVL